MKNDYTLGEWLWQWYNLYKKDFISADWQKQYERAFILHIPKDLFDKRLVDISALDIDLALFDMGRTRTANFVYNIYRSSLHKAYLVGFLYKDISELITRPKYSSRKSKPLTDEEIECFFATIKDYDVYYFYKFLLLTGCRRSEALSLKFSDIDTKNDVIHIRGTKTINSDRYIPLTCTIASLICDLPRTQDFLFPFTKDYVTKFFKRYCPNHKLHDLRHTFATRCAHAGLHPAVTQSLLGHATPEFTLKVYTHINCAQYINNVDDVQKKFPAI